MYILCVKMSEDNIKSPAADMLTYSIEIVVGYTNVDTVLPSRLTLRSTDVDPISLTNAYTGYDALQADEPIGLFRPLEHERHATPEELYFPEGHT